MASQEAEQQGQKAPSRRRSGGKQPEGEQQESRQPEGKQAEDRTLGHEVAAALEPALSEFERRLSESLHQELEQVLVSGQEQGSPQESPPAEQPEGRGAASRTRGESKTGGNQMATESAQRERREAQDDTEEQDRQEEDGGGRSGRSGQTRSLQKASPRRSEVERSGSDRRQVATTDRRGRSRPSYPWDPRRLTQIGLLRIAHSWNSAGSLYSAIYAYEELLIRYPGSGAAEAAADELVEIAQELAREGRLYTALHVLRKLDELT
jgi:hypothetical protein